MSTPSEHVPGTAVGPDMQPFWMPFTANRQFKAAPRLVSRAEGMYYFTPEGRQVLDGSAGLWCVNAGHGRKEISEAVARQIQEMEYAPLFNMGHPIAFQFAERVAARAPEGLNKVSAEPFKINEIKGGCNPAPLSRTAKGDKIIVKVKDIIEQGSFYFNFKRS